MVPPAIADVENADDIDIEPDDEPSSSSRLGKLGQDGIALLIAAVAKVKQAAAAVRAKIWACWGDQGPAHEGDEDGEAAAGWPSTLAQLRDLASAVRGTFNVGRPRWRLLGVASAHGNNDQQRNSYIELTTMGADSGGAN